MEGWECLSQVGQKSFTFSYCRTAQLTVLVVTNITSTIVPTLSSSVVVVVATEIHCASPLHLW